MTKSRQKEIYVDETCNAKFTDFDDFKAHLRSRLHRFEVLRREINKLLTEYELEKDNP